MSFEIKKSTQFRINELSIVTKTGDAIVIIAQYQYEYTFVVDKEICIAAMLNKLLKL